MEYVLLNSQEKYSILSSEKKQKDISAEKLWKIGQIIEDKYEILDILAQDKKKIIYKVRHCQWNIPLAVRSQLEKESQVRFFHQAERWVQLEKHPNVVSAYYVQHIGGVPRLFVEYVTNAKTLKEYMETQPYDLEDVLDIGIQISWGMDHAHKKGLLHGDLRPGNIFITDEGEAKVTDFRSREGIEIEYTPYMPPEQFEKDYPALPSIDIYAFGVILYEMCVKDLPFKLEVDLNTEEGREEFRNLILTQPPIAPNKIDPNIPESLSNLIMECISSTPSERPTEFEDISQELKEIYKEITGFTYPREEPESNKLMAVDLNNRALSLLDLGEEEEKAEEYLEEAIEKDPECTGALINLCLLKLRKNEITLAKFLETTKRLLEKKEREVVTYYRGKICLEKGGFLASMLSEVNEALKIYPNNKELLRLKGAILYRLGKFEESIKIFEELVNSEKYLKKDLYYLGASYLELGKKKKALEFFEKGLEEYPGDPYFWLGKGISYALQGKLEDAYNQYKNIIEYSNDNWAKLHLAEMSLALGDYVKTYKKATPHLEDARNIYSELIKFSYFLPRVVRGYKKSFKRDKLDAEIYKGKSQLPLWSYYKRLEGHEEGIHCMAITKDGRIVVTGGGDKYIKIWEIEKGICKHKLEAHPDGTTSIKVTQDGHFAVSIGRDSNILVWDLISGECVSKLEGHGKDVTSITLTNTGYLLSVSLDKTLRIWDLGSLSCKKILRGHTDKINVVVTTPDGSLAFTGGEDKKIGIWDIEGEVLLNFLEEHPEGITSLCVSPNSKWLISASWDHKIRVFDIELAECIGVLEGHTGTINCLEITPDSKKIISGSEDKTIKIWDIEKLTCIHTLKGHSVDVTCLAISPTSNFLVSGSWDHTIRIWDIETGENLGVLEGHTDLVNCVGISPNEKFIISGGDDEVLRMWTDLMTFLCPLMKESQLSYLLERPKSKHGSFEAQRKVEKLINKADERIKQGEYKAALEIYREIQKVEGFKHNVRVLDSIYNIAKKNNLKRGKPLSIWKHKILEGHKREITCIAIHPQENIIVTGSKDCILRIWDIYSGECISILEGHKGPICSLAMGPYGRFIISGSYDNTIKLWELETARCIYTLEGHKHWVEHVLFTPDGRRVISGSRDSTIRIWERKTGHRLYSLTLHTDLISVLKINPSAEYIVSGSHDRTIRIWNLDNGKCVHNLEAHTNHIKCIECFKNKPYIISGGWDGVLYLWDIDEGECIKSFKGHESWINDIALIEDKNKFISCSLDRTIRVWDIENEKCISVFYGHNHDVNKIIVSDDGRFCISASWDKTIRVWDIEENKCLKVLEGHTQEITLLKTLKEMRYIISGSKDNTLIIWEVDWEWE